MNSMKTTNNWSIPENLSNEQGIELAYSLLEQMKSGKLKEDELQKRIIDLVASKTGARNFLGAYLTRDSSLPEKPSAAVLNALRTSPEIVGELMAKNLIMPTAMAITHRRNNDEEMAKGSERVCQRAAYLIEQLNLETIQQQLQLLLNTIVTGKGEYQSFLERWGYDQEQKQAMQEKITQII